MCRPNPALYWRQLYCNAKFGYCHVSSVVVVCDASVVIELFEFDDVIRRSGAQVRGSFRLLSASSLYLRNGEMELIIAWHNESLIENK